MLPRLLLWLLKWVQTCSRKHWGSAMGTRAQKTPCLCRKIPKTHDWRKHYFQNCSDPSPPGTGFSSWVIGQITGLCVTLCIKLFITIVAAHLTMPGLQYIRARRCALISICALRLRLKNCLTEPSRSLRTSFAMVTGCQEMSRQCYLSVRDEH
jgi:hypothetical protein